VPVPLKHQIWGVLGVLATGLAVWYIISTERQLANLRSENTELMCEVSTKNTEIFFLRKMVDHRELHLLGKSSEETAPCSKCGVQSKK
jgi:hypothetical protein